MTPATTVALEPPDRPDVVALIEALDAYQSALYPAESNHLLDLAALRRPEVAFAVARDAAGRAVGCGAAVLAPPQGELKRMYVDPARRGGGIAKRLIALLEATAHERGCRVLRLETGISQPEALGLYEASGYRRRGPFGAYTDDPLSVFMEKTLG